MISFSERINISERDRQRLVSFLVDFNSVRNRDRIGALGRYSAGGWQPLSPGDPVLVHDSEGNEAIAYVEARRGTDLLDLRVDWETWVPGEQPKVRILSVPVASAGVRAEIR